MARSTFLVLLAMAVVLVGTVVADDKPPKKKAVWCKDKKGLPLCGGQYWNCPDDCPRNCKADCDLCRPVCHCDKGGAVCQDPRFIGGDGITFYFHGRKNRDFCLFSDSDLHINAHFIGRRNPEMKRDFTWVQAIAVLFGAHKLYIGAQKTASWDDDVDRLAISFDGEPIFLPLEDGAKWSILTAPAVSVVRSSAANAVTVEVEGKFRLTANVVPVTDEESRVHSYGITSDDCFAHLELGFKFYSLSKDVHGVLGQTYREGYVSRVKMSAKNPIMSGEKEFAVSGLYTADCAVSRFGHGDAGIALATEKADEVTCSSGMRGRGIVCKK